MIKIGEVYFRDIWRDVYFVYNELSLNSPFTKNTSTLIIPYHTNSENMWFKVSGVDMWSPSKNFDFPNEKLGFNYIGHYYDSTKSLIDLGIKEFQNFRPADNMRERITLEIL